MRLCKTCNLNIVEDEFHFICVCNAYIVLRKQLSKDVSNIVTNFDTLSIYDKLLFIMFSSVIDNIYLLDNIYIRFGTKLYRHIVGIPIGTNCAPLVADLFLFCYERDFMTSLSDVKQAEIIEAFKSTSRYLDDLLNIDNPNFEGMVNRIYPPELQLKRPQCR